MLTKEHIDGLNNAFNEARLLGAEIDVERRIVALTIAGICMNSDGTIPEDRRVQIILEPIGKFLASFRNSRWDDDEAKAVPFLQNELLTVVQSFGGQSIYGWEFFDCGEKSFARWKDRLSFSYEASGEGYSHTLDLFQDGNNKILELKIWFDHIHIIKPNGDKVPIEEFIAAGKRGWDAIMLNNDKHAQDTFAIYPRR